MIVLKGEEREDLFAEDVRKGLTATHKHISSKYFYDDEGSLLFEQIMDLEEYYPTRCETQIMRNYKDTVLKHLDSHDFHLVDIGAGDGEKTLIFIEHFTQSQMPFDFIPIDISQDALEQLENKLATAFPQLKVTPVVAEYSDALSWIQKNTSKQKLVLFLGGNIGNFTKANAQRFLQSIQRRLNPNDLFYIGFDLKKDPRTIRTAYDDAKGVTAKFNFNLLKRINDELEADFDISTWQHYASYDPVNGAVQSYLLPETEQTVTIRELDLEVHFQAWDPIHTEYSFKYTIQEIEDMAAQCGFEVVEHCFSENKYFVDSIFRVQS